MPTPPVGFGTYTVYFDVAGAPRQQSNTWAFQNVAGDVNPTAALTRMQISAISVGSIYNPSFFCADGTIVKQYILLNIGGFLTSAESLVPSVGTSTFDPVSPNVSGVVIKRTIYAGRQYRGRCALPSVYLDEADVSPAGEIGPSASALATALANFRTRANTNGQPLYLLHDTRPLPLVTPSPTAISQVDFSTLVGSERRRLKRS